VIRRATVEDARGIAELHTRTWQAAYRHILPAADLDALDVGEREERWRQNLARPEVPTFVVEEDGAFVGFVTVGPSRDPDCDGELYGIYVAPEAWGSGAGAALTAAALGELHARYAEAALWVLEDNPRARRFYEKHGWSPDGTQKTGRQLGVDTAEMRYRISLAEPRRLSP
jgi:ribosomal protein S18 acetylase RimI-like enzyme